MYICIYIYVCIYMYICICISCISALHVYISLAIHTHTHTHTGGGAPRRAPTTKLSHGVAVTDSGCLPTRNPQDIVTGQLVQEWDGAGRGKREAAAPPPAATAAGTQFTCVTSTVEKYTY